MKRRALIVASAFALGGCGRKKPAAGVALPAGSTVLALGDSITFGTGADSAAAYPAQLAALRGFLADRQAAYRVGPAGLLGHRDLSATECPGTALYAGYNDVATIDGFDPRTGVAVPGFRRNGRTVFVKLSYLLRTVL